MRMIDQPTCFLKLAAKCSLKLDSTNLFTINPIITLYMDHLILTYVFLHLTIGKFRIAKTNIRFASNLISEMGWRL